jgi:hypothetical protein
MRKLFSAGDAAFLVSLLATTMAAALVHALELPNKIGMPRDDYFIVEKVYQRWDQLGFVLGVELVGIIALIVVYRGQQRVLALVLAALSGLVVA